MNTDKKFKRNKSEQMYDAHEENTATIAATKKSTSTGATFQAAMKLTILTAQCFGLSPVLGICDPDADKLRFTIGSARCVYSLFTIGVQIWLLILCILQMTDPSFSFSKNSTIAFYGTTCIESILFFRVAMHWPKLCQYIYKIEETDSNLSNKLIRRINASFIVVMSLAFLEHLLRKVNVLALAIDCRPHKTLFDAFLLEDNPLLWDFHHYNRFLGIFAMVASFQCTFIWNFSDTFIICISWYLIARLEQVNERIVALRGKIYVPASYWRTIREDYNKTTSFVRKVDELVNGIIFITFANNLFSICAQLLHTLEKGIKATPVCHKNLEVRPFNGYEHVVYFLFSLVFLIMRALAVSLIASQVHSASLEPAKTLYDVPSESYCAEVQRLLDQIHGDTVALSGLDFFQIRRGLILTIAATIVTYELVLIQFSGISPNTPSDLPETEVNITTTPGT